MLFLWISNMIQIFHIQFLNCRVPPLLHIWTQHNCVWKINARAYIKSGLWNIAHTGCNRNCDIPNKNTFFKIGATILFLGMLYDADCLISPTKGAAHAKGFRRALILSHPDHRVRGNLSIRKFSNSSNKIHLHCNLWGDMKGTGKKSSSKFRFC